VVVLLGGNDGPWAAAARLTVLLGEGPKERAALFSQLRGEQLDADLVRRALVEVLMQGDRLRLVSALDESLIGLASRPASYLAARATVAI
jgi:hypothetical protein